MSKIFLVPLSSLLLGFCLVLPVSAQEATDTTPIVPTPVVLTAPDATSTSNVTTSSTINDIPTSPATTPEFTQDEHIGPGGVMTPDMKRTIRERERDLKSILRMLKGKNNAAMEAELAEIQSILDSAKDFSYDEWFTVDWDALQKKLEHMRQTIDSMSKAKEMIGRIGGIERNLTALEKTIAKLKRQKITVPSELTEKIAHVKAVLSAVKNATTMEEMENVGWEDMLDEVRELDDSRQMLQMLSQFPQMAKRMDLEIKKLEQAIKKYQRLASSLTAKGFDLKDKMTDFEQAVSALKKTRDEIKQKVASGFGEEAFQAMENDFFGKIDETWQSGRVIEMISRLSGFAGSLNQKILNDEQRIRQLEKKNLDTAELKAKLADIKEQGKQIANLIKEKNTDEIEEAIDDFEAMNVEFENALDELIGNSENRPWDDTKAQKPMSYEYKSIDAFFTRTLVALRKTGTVLSIAP